MANNTLNGLVDLTNKLITNSEITDSTIANSLISVQDNNLTIYDNSDNTKKFKFDCSNLPTATTTTLGIGYFGTTYPSTQLTTNNTPITGTTFWVGIFTINPPSANWSLTKIFNIVFLTLDGFTRTANVTAQAVTQSSFIPAELRPSSTVFNSIPGANGVSQTISVVVNPSGTVNCSVTNGASFTSGSTAQVASICIWWKV